MINRLLLRGHQRFPKKITSTITTTFLHNHSQQRVSQRDFFNSILLNISSRIIFTIQHVAFFKSNQTSLVLSSFPISYPSILDRFLLLFAQHRTMYIFSPPHHILLPIPTSLLPQHLLFSWAFNSFIHTSCLSCCQSDFSQSNQINPIPCGKKRSYHIYQARKKTKCIPYISCISFIVREKERYKTTESMENKNIHMVRLVRLVRFSFLLWIFNLSLSFGTSTNETSIIIRLTLQFCLYFITIYTNYILPTILKDENGIWYTDNTVVFTYVSSSYNIHLTKKVDL
jgi:hypothetical protein